jgi:hypothetical protein
VPEYRDCCSAVFDAHSPMTAVRRGCGEREDKELNAAGELRAQQASC